MSSSVGIAVTAEPQPPSRAIVPRAPNRSAPSPPAFATETVAQRQGRPARSQARPVQRETEGSGAGKQPARQPLASPPDRQQPAPGFSPATSAAYLAQALGQAPDEGSEGPLQRHRDRPSLGSGAYRRAGGEPPIYPEAARLVRLTV